MSSQPKIRTERTWPHLGKEVQGYTQQFEIWHGTSLIILIKIQKEPMLRTIWEPCFGHEPNFGHFSKRRTQGKPKNVKFGIEHRWVQKLRLRKSQFKGLHENHVSAIKGPYFGRILYTVHSTLYTLTRTQYTRNKPRMKTYMKTMYCDVILVWYWK